MRLKCIGVYDYTVILTYISLLSSVFGMTLAIGGNYRAAVFCLAFSGVCDAFDGRIARTKKNRTEDEKNFGIQLDSLCDVVCFGVFPAMLCYRLGLCGVVGLIIVFFYCLCAVIRLAFFNVLEGNRQKAEGGCNKAYRGLPVTSIAFILPVAFWLRFLLPSQAFVIALHIILLVVGFLFILDFSVPKPGLKAILSMILVGAIALGTILVYSRLHRPAYTEAGHTAEETISDLNNTENR